RYVANNPARCQSPAIGRIIALAASTQRNLLTGNTPKKGRAKCPGLFGSSPQLSLEIQTESKLNLSVGSQPHRAPDCGRCAAERRSRGGRVKGLSRLDSIALGHGIPRGRKPERKRRPNAVISKVRRIEDVED